MLLPEEAAAADHALGTVWAGPCANSILLFSSTVLLALVLAHDWKLLHPCLSPTRLGGATEAEGGFSMKYNKQSDSALSNPEKLPCWPSSTDQNVFSKLFLLSLQQASPWAPASIPAEVPCVTATEVRHATAWLCLLYSP